MIEELVKTEKSFQPAKQWVNWWRDKDDGHTYPDCEWFPSKDICEQKAIEELAWDFVYLGCQPEDHLGAFPEGERPI